MKKTEAKKNKESDALQAKYKIAKDEAEDVAEFKMMRSDLERENKELEAKLQNLLNEYAQTRTKAQVMLVEKNDEIARLKQKFGSDEKTEEPVEPKLDQTSRAYIKSVLLKFLEYQAEQMEREALMMEKVLFTVLKMRPEEVEGL